MAALGKAIQRIEWRVLAGLRLMHPPKAVVRANLHGISVVDLKLPLTKVCFQS
jgi:hypothetical protein